MGDYVDVQQLKDAIDPNGSLEWSTADESNLELAISAAERYIDEVTGTHWKAQAAVTRTYTAHDSDILWIDDLLAVTTLKTDDDADGVYETTWTTDDYRLMPANAAADGRPYRWIEIKDWGDYAFPSNLEQGVQIVGTFGATTTAPANIQLAALLIAQRLWQRHQHLFGRGHDQIVLPLSHLAADKDVAALLSCEYLGYVRA